MKSISYKININNQFVYNMYFQFELSRLHNVCVNSPWYAPQNQIPLFPWMVSSSSEAFDAAKEGMG